MKFLVISDVHANMIALEAVLNNAKKIGYDKLIFCGDIVGYGPQPNECCEWAKQEQSNGGIFVIGNHDKSISEDGSLAWYNPSAAKAIEIHRSIVTSENKSFLASLPLNHIDEANHIHFVHGSPYQWDDYIQERWEAEAHFKSVIGDICFIGHTHTPAIWKEDGNPKIVNVGSVGQPRDDNPKASFCIYNPSAMTDAAKVVIYRVAYDVASVQEKMKNINMPKGLIDRIAKGW